MTMRRYALAGLLGVLTVAGLSAGTPRVPDKLMSARKIFLVNDRVDTKVFDKIARDLARWRRLEVVRSESDAHVVAILSQQPSGIEIPPEEFAVDKNNLYLIFKDAATRVLLWSEPGELPGNWESIVSRLRKRIEKQDTR